MRRKFNPKLFALLASIFGATVNAGEPTPQSSWPQKFTVTVGDVRTRVDGPKMWTLSGLDYQNTVMAVEDSAYGTVVSIRNVGHLGTAHFLDVPGKPGEVEKENVTDLKLFVDDKPLTEFKPTMEVRGSSFRMERTSNIRGIHLKCSADLRDGVLIETSTFEVKESIDLVRSDPLMYAWTSAATVYLLGDDSGIQKRGTFLTEKGTRSEKMEKQSSWMAVFDPSTGKGSVCYLLEYPPGTEGWFLLIDCPFIYRKQALYTMVDRVLPVGFTGTYRTAITFFSATESDWEQQALAKVESLKSIKTTSVNP